MINPLFPSFEALCSTFWKRPWEVTQSTPLLKPQSTRWSIHFFLWILKSFKGRDPTTSPGSLENLTAQSFSWEEKFHICRQILLHLKPPFSMPVPSTQSCRQCYHPRGVLVKFMTQFKDTLLLCRPACTPLFFHLQAWWECTVCVILSPGHW